MPTLGVFQRTTHGAEGVQVRPFPAGAHNSPRGRRLAEMREMTNCVRSTLAGPHRGSSLSPNCAKRKDPEKRNADRLTFVHRDGELVLCHSFIFAGMQTVMYCRILPDETVTRLYMLFTAEVSPQICVLCFCQFGKVNRGQTYQI